MSKAGFGAEKEERRERKEGGSPQRARRGGVDSRLRGNDRGLPPSPPGIPAMRGGRRRATTRVAPTTGLSGSIFVATAHVGCHFDRLRASMKMGAERRTGNHKGCPYDRFAGVYFQRNDRGVRVVAFHRRGCGECRGREQRVLYGKQGCVT